MEWKEVCNDPHLKNLPFKIELNEHGRIIMSPVKVYHSVLQGEIAALLGRQRIDGKILTECAINTRKGTKVADVAWASKNTFNIIKHEIECSIAPEVCIEILSTSNTDSEIEEKKLLYFEKGANEVWICNKGGCIQFFNPQGIIDNSNIFSNFSNRIDYNV